MGISTSNQTWLAGKSPILYMKVSMALECFRSFSHVLFLFLVARSETQLYATADKFDLQFVYSCPDLGVAESIRVVCLDPWSFFCQIRGPFTDDISGG